MKNLIKFLGLGLVILGIYFLGQNIFFTTNVNPYWWRGIAADVSILSLIVGTLTLVFAPGDLKKLGWIVAVFGVLMVFISGKAILNPTSLWQFFVSFASFSIGYHLMVYGRLPF